MEKSESDIVDGMRREATSLERWFLSLGLPREELLEKVDKRQAKLWANEVS